MNDEPTEAFDEGEIHGRTGSACGLLMVGGFGMGYAFAILVENFGGGVSGPAYAVAMGLLGLGCIYVGLRYLPDAREVWRHVETVGWDE